MLPRAATEHDATQDRISNLTVRAVRQIWRRMRGRNWEQAWRTDVGPDVQRVVQEAQGAAVASSSVYVGTVLAELGIEGQPDTALNIDALVGVAGDGRPVDSLTYGAVIRAAKAQYTPEAQTLTLNQAAAQALDEAFEWMDEMVAGILADSVRAAETVATAQRPWVTGYVRMVSPGACSRCVVLAGKFYKYNDGFDRHPPTCKCRHIPANENVAGDMVTDPRAYFDNLSARQQDETFTEAGAEAIRLGADVGQVVNSRRGMQVAQVADRRIVTTTAGVRRGATRLMPETILAEATSPEDALRLLQRFGYVT